MKSKLSIYKITLMLLLALCFSYSSKAQFKVVGYAPSWSQTPIQYSKLTHINYSFALPQYGGRLKAVDNPAYLQSIVSNAHANNVKVFIAIGGWSDNGTPIDPIFESIGGDAGSRANFINDALYIVNTFNLDGVDVDWEYPDQGNSSNNFTTLMRELSNALKPKGKGLSFAGPADNYSSAGIASSVFQYVDFVNIMAYDGPGANHSTYQFAVDGLNLYKSKGCPANKCIVGVPFYARPSWRAYSDLVASGANPNADWFGSDAYNGIPTIKQKTEMALRDAGGIMIWALSQDAQGANSLLSAINDVVKSTNNNNNGVTNLGGTYKLQNRFSGMYLDIDGASSNDGARVQQWSGNTCACQNYTFSHLGNGVYKILAAHSGKSLDVSNISTSDGAAIVQWPYWANGNQQFKVVAAGDGYYKLFAQNSGKLIEVGGWSTTPGGIVQQWADYGQSTGQWKLVPVGSSNFSTTIQAENFNSMMGVQTEGTTDAGGGSNVGYIDNSDWMAYFNINFPTSGSYTVEYRVASVSGGRLSMDLNAGSIQLGAVNVPATGGWQNWTTVTQTINVNAGTYNVGIFSQTGGWNFNWFKITKNSGAKMAMSAIENTETITSDYSLGKDFDVSPNPVLEELSITAPFNTSGGNLQIISGMGTEVLNVTLQNNFIDVSNLQGGIYTLIYNRDGNKIVKRFIKQ